MPEQMTYMGMYTTDEDGKIVFIRFPVPLVVEHDCEDEETPAGTRALRDLRNQRGIDA